MCASKPSLLKSRELPQAELCADVAMTSHSDRQDDRDLVSGHRGKAKNPSKKPAAGLDPLDFWASFTRERAEARIARKNPVKTVVSLT
jgi:hypothetical protein